VTTSQKSSDLVSYPIYKDLPKHQQPSNEKSQHTEKNRLWKSDPRGRSCTRDRLESPRNKNNPFETDFKTLIKKLGTQRKNCNPETWQEKHAEESQTYSPSPCPFKAIYLSHYPQKWCTLWSSPKWGWGTTFDLRSYVESDQSRSTKSPPCLPPAKSKMRARVDGPKWRTREGGVNGSR
jgi:hypothetical protein